MATILEGSERPITDMLDIGASWVPGFYNEDIDALDEVSGMLNDELELTGAADHNFGSTKSLEKDSALAHITRKFLQLVDTSEEVKDGVLPALGDECGAMARRFGPGEGISWHRDKPLLGVWATSLIVAKGDGITEIAPTNSPIPNRRNPYQIKSKKGDLIILRGRFTHGVVVPYTRRRPLHRAFAGDQGREIVGTY